MKRFVELPSGFRFVKFRREPLPPEVEKEYDEAIKRLVSASPKKGTRDVTVKVLRRSTN